MRGAGAGRRRKVRVQVARDGSEQAAAPAAPLLAPHLQLGQRLCHVAVALLGGVHQRLLHDGLDGEAVALEPGRHGKAPAQHRLHVLLRRQRLRAITASEREGRGGVVGSPHSIDEEDSTAALATQQQTNTRLQQRQHGLEQQPVVGVAAEAEDGDAVVGLRDEGQRRVVDQHGARQVAVDARHVLDARVVVGAQRALAVDAPREEAALGVDRVDDGARIVLQACVRERARIEPIECFIVRELCDARLVRPRSFLTARTHRR